MILGSPKPFQTARERLSQPARCPRAFGATPARKARAFAAVQQLETTLGATELLSSPHPDALKRRKAAEERQRRREQERQARLNMQAQGLNWWEAPTPANMKTISSGEEYRAAVEEAANAGRLLVAVFFTESCYVCKSLHPKLTQIAAQNPDVSWVKLNGTSTSLVPLFQALDIRKIPYFHFVRDRELVSEMSASLSPQRLAVFKAELAAHKPSAVHPTVPAPEPASPSPSVAAAAVVASSN